MTISTGSDHCGYELKVSMIAKLKEWGHDVIDNGGSGSSEVIYFPEMAKKVCAPVLEGRADRAIMFCGTGVGAAIACNKIPGIRASMIHDVQCAHQAVEHDAVQVMCIGAKVVGEWLAEDLIKTFLEAEANRDEWTAEVVRMLNVMDGIE